MPPPAFLIRYDILLLRLFFDTLMSPRCRPPRRYALMAQYASVMLIHSAAHSLRRSFAISMPDGCRINVNTGVMRAYAFERWFRATFSLMLIFAAACRVTPGEVCLPLDAGLMLPRR